MSDIFIYDEFGPEDTAMMQALYSRSPKSVVEHVEKVKASGSGKFMETFYVGYGHASIADCGSTTIFIEKISILADKAIQDWQMYSGQETSTRYIDMSKQPIIDPIGTPESKAIIDAWMDFYISSQEPMHEYLMQKYPKKADEDQAVYDKAIKARTFDILRGFLPAGITTQLSWHSNLRQAWDKLSWMMHHPLPEVKEIAKTILEKLQGKYAHSFSHQITDEQNKYREEAMAKYNYYTANHEVKDVVVNTSIKNEDLKSYLDIINNRPVKTGLPPFLADLGTVSYEFPLDFGSFRDIQRHRNGVCRMPLLTIDLGFHNWYLGELREDLRAKAEILISSQKEKINALSISPEIKQYYIALGFNVACRVSYGLPASAYVIELRSGRAVHPTLRAVAHSMQRELNKILPDFVLHCDMEKDDWDVRRGLQDITAR